MIYFSYFIKKYAITFWGNPTDSKQVFQLQEKVVRIMRRTKSIISCTPSFKAL